MMRTTLTHFWLLAAIPFAESCLASDQHAPSVDVFGSYFPAWMACIVIGLVATVLVRLVLIGFGLHAHLRPKALVYPCMVILFTMAIWLVFFKN